MPTVQPTVPVPPPLQRGYADLTERPRRRSQVPLKSERMQIVVRGPLALVCREQVFRNDDDRTIEATITFPVPVHATLHRLSARIDGRTLAARALRRDAARETYEAAVEDGKTAMLHEELVRGVHVLSIAHIPPGATITVTHAWVISLAARSDDTWHVRIPVTVGDLYGVSQFGDADDLVTSPHVVHQANVEVDCGDAIASVGGAPVAPGRSLSVVLYSPIDLEIAGLASLSAEGVAADGRGVRVSVTPDRGGDATIEAAILVDRSGSMAEPMSSTTKHAAVVAGLSEAAGALRPRDRAELWEFDNTATRVGGRGLALAQAIADLGAPRGGTEIGSALTTVIGGSSAADVILVTDGLSHALDVQALALSGRRFTVVLVGDDAFEANVGRLAAMTGGQIYLVGRTGDAAAAVRAAIASVRRPKAPFLAAEWPLARAEGQSGGALVKATWQLEAGTCADAAFAGAVGAFAAALALPRLSAEQAAKVALEHGLVTHLTSLVLVDEAGAIQSELPAQRKVPLMAPRCHSVAPAHASLAAGAGSMPELAFAPMPCAPPPTSGKPSIANLLRSRVRRLEAPAAAVVPVSRPDPAAREAMKLAEIARRIDWGANPEALRRGELSDLAADIARQIVAASTVPEVVSLAVSSGGNAVTITVGLLAKSRGAWSRAAVRIAKAVLAGLDKTAVAKAMAALGL